MKFTLPAKQLSSALATLKPIAKPNTTHAQLGNVAITADKDSITLLGMDLDRQLEITFPAKVKQSGATTVPCSRICDFLDDADGDCVIESNDKQETVIRIGNAVCHILGLPIEDMPPRIAVVEGTEIHMPAKQFNDLLAKSVLHASIDPTRARECSVAIISRNGKMDIQGTCGRRGIICASETEMKSGSYLVARESVPAMVKLSEDGELVICFGENTMSVKAESMEFRTRLLDFAPANLAGVFPKDSPLKIAANRLELDSIVKRAQKGTSEQSTCILLECDGKSLTARGAKVVKASEGEFFDMNEDSARVAKGSAVIKLQLNPQFLRDALKCMAKDEVTLECVDETTPIVIQEDGVRCVICPMKVS